MRLGVRGKKDTGILVARFVIEVLSMEFVDLLNHLEDKYIRKAA
jgi:hypothetical protein